MVGYTIWKDATDKKSGGFATHEHSEVGCKLLIAICFV